MAGATSLNCSTTALYSHAAVAKMSKLVSTCVPSMSTLNALARAVQYSWTKCSRIAPAVNPGMA